MDNVIQIPEREKPEDLLIGPFEEWRVQVEGRIIPRLTGFKDGDKIALVLDGRWSASFNEEDARQAAWLIANALAIGEGYAFLGSANKDQPFAPMGIGLGSLDDIKPA
jgi:hypothetical protein